MASNNSLKERFGRTFGGNTLLGNGGDDFFDKTPENQAMEIGWAEGCPVPTSVVANRGPETSAKRYGEIIMARQLIWESARFNNLDLFTELTKDVDRLLPGEPAGTYEPGNVPGSHPEEIIANNTHWGFALPRILIVAYGKKDEGRGNRVMVALQTVDDVMKRHFDSPHEFMAVLAESLIGLGVDKDQILRNILSAGYLQENNTYTSYQLLVTEMMNHSPELIERYKQLTQEEKHEFGIA
ncbi:hypothetical protein A2872_01605 [Candidatus Gottesmanbacteria bacterium RIFCSPHIGHO2_01_FULL_42_12]|uniref:Uncharacterized protein n=1 Tax=Candidatus Gottesmanbacteria bacterium RIFCSPHIGHO2_01_FULL_42_12 TaxID=1798377 RepID=A0A1F5Z4I2_9BACT|nr:MAG: hypothetical protein A2872_01605 [Candidatus Gottesmanbacteria bacterium RIFCSPHIGHO2_01_FULL_42_12]